MNYAPQWRLRQVITHHGTSRGTDLTLAGEDKSELGRDNEAAEEGQGPHVGGIVP